MPPVLTLHHHHLCSDEDQSGCTAIVGIVTDKHVIVANAGDARGILHVGGVTKPMSFDHKPTLEKETARIEAAGGCVSMKRVNGDLAVSRALGDFTYKRTASVAPKDQMVSAFPDIEIHERTGEEQTGEEPRCSEGDKEQSRGEK